MGSLAPGAVVPEVAAFAHRRWRPGGKWEFYAPDGDGGLSVDDLDVAAMRTGPVRPPADPARGNGVWLAVLLGNELNTDGRGREMGYLALRRRILHRLGYLVVTVNHARTDAADSLRAEAVRKAILDAWRNWGS